MKKRLNFFACSCLILFFMTACKHEPLFTAPASPLIESATCSADTIYFRQQVLPIFISNCTMSGCHDAITRKEGVVLDSYDNILKTGKIIPYQPLNSKSYKLIIENNPGDRMPPNGSLTQIQKDIVYKWILQGARNNSCSNNCDSTIFTYSAAIKPLISLKCEGCHNSASPQGGIDLSSYAGVKNKVADGKLWGSINHMTGFSAMPKNGLKLSDCELKQFENWIKAGALNN